MGVLPKLVVRTLVYTASLHDCGLFPQDYNLDKQTEERPSSVFIFEFKNLYRVLGNLFV